jgi:hypothetical protein
VPTPFKVYLVQTFKGKERGLGCPAVEATAIVQLASEYAVKMTAAAMWKRLDAMAAYSTNFILE